MEKRNNGQSATGNQEEGKCPNEEETLLFQMERKYFCQEDDGGPQSNEASKYILDIFGSSPCKAAHERLLELLVLDNLGICRIGSTDKFASLARKVTELDLSSNRLDWPSVGQLFLVLPQLRTLNLSQNSDLGTNLANELPKAPKLSTLILNGLSLSLSTLQSIVQSAPALREMHLSKAKFPELNKEKYSLSISETLDELHVNNCGIEDWCQVLAILRLFPKLESLFLADNPLGSVQRECRGCDEETMELSSRMRTISLSNTGIESWESIENLEAIGQLEELRISHIPLLEDYTVEERIHLVVARLRSLKILNGSTVDANQREESERFFIRYYAGMEKKPLVYDQLVAEHGMLDQLVKVDLTPKRYAKVAIHCEETEWIRMWIRLRLTGTVQELMKFAEGLTKIPHKLMRIFYVDKTLGPPWPTELRFPNQQLKMLHIEDGDEFFVQSKLVIGPQQQFPSSRAKQKLTRTSTKVEAGKS